VAWLDFSGRKALRLCGDLIELTEKLKRRVDALELDYEALYDKVRSALQRVSKRAEVVEKAAQHDTPPELTAMPSTGQNGSGAGLSDHQRQVQQQILRRRAGMQ
jgi:chromosome condensin MukBEF MukE localization factor